MNPSANGWIKKHLSFLNRHLRYGLDTDIVSYNTFRNLGFIYGTSISTLNNDESGTLNWSEQERTKINLFDALAITYYNSHPQGNDDECLTAILVFYNALTSKQIGFVRLSKISKGNSFEALESILQQRIQTNESFFKKNFSHIITNALLYLDVLAFKQFLETNSSPLHYSETIEAGIIHTITLALAQKKNKQKYDDLVLRLFKSSVRYNNHIEKPAALDVKDLYLKTFNNNLEKRYLLDLVCLAIWNDNVADSSELQFLDNLGKHLAFSEQKVIEAKQSVQLFINNHQSEISLFQYSNPVNHFYKQTNSTVRLLIMRNKKRLLVELFESRELLQLLRHSTYRELTAIEKQKVKSQLVDICKTIPSLAIFILPGGSILLPLLIKMIPKLLPSAFNENFD